MLLQVSEVNCSLVLFATQHGLIWRHHARGIWPWRKRTYKHYVEELELCLCTASRHYLDDSLRGQALRHLSFTSLCTLCFTCIATLLYIQKCFSCTHVPIYEKSWGGLNCQIQQLCFVEWLSDDCLILSVHATVPSFAGFKVINWKATALFRSGM